MLWLYRIVFLPLLALAAPFYLLRMKRRGGYRRHFSQRFGNTPELGEKSRSVRRVWLHAVSVGEMLAIAPILEAFKHDPQVEVYLTTTTSTGYKIARERYQEMTLGVGYFPLDWWLFSRRAWKRIQPDIVILTEGERWPEHVFQAVKRQVPVLCVNARMSDRSFGRMKKLGWMAQPLLRGVTKILACSEHDADRFRQLGFPADSVMTTGNIKLDLNVASLPAEALAQLRSQLGLGTDPVILGSSTWPGEEDVLIKVLKEARASGQACRLLLVPRHAERRDQIEATLKGSGLSYHFRTYGNCAGQVDVAVGDTTGELRKLTQLADVVFVGKSLPPHDQGQTPVEAAALGKPLVHGPGMSNFRHISAELNRRGASRIVETPEELSKQVTELLKDRGLRETMGKAAVEWHASNQGAVSRTLEVIRQHLAKLA